jgi:hypothetical protein
VELFSVMPEKIRAKKCCFCPKMCSDVDEIDSERTMAWGKESCIGKACAYCWAAKMKLWPHKELKLVYNQVSTDPEKNKFFGCRFWLIAQYLAGSKAARGTFQVEETVSVMDETMLLQRDKGKAVLLTSYQANHGDPVANGHTVTKTVWKDGAIQDVVLVPSCPVDEMDVEFVRKRGIVHTRLMDNGQLSAGPKQQANLYRDLCESQRRVQAHRQSDGPGFVRAEG